MKKVIWITCIIMLFTTASAQNWMTTGGSAGRNGISSSYAPEAVSTPAWTINDAGQSLWGNAIYTANNRFATSRVTFSPVYKVSVECRSLLDGSLLWEKEAEGESKLYVVGMTDYAVYVHDYQTDSLYSLNPADGTVRWVCPEKARIFGGAHGILFTCDGDPVVNGPGLYENSLMRLDQYNGEVKWFNTNLVSVSPAPDFCIAGDKLYKWEGAIGAPTHLVAVDLNTGENLYYSEEIPGEALQEIPLTAGPDGTIYGQRDGGDLWAFTDDGTAFSVKWFYSPENGGMGTYGNIGIGAGGTVLFPDGNVVKRLDPATGSLLSTSPPLSTNAMWGTYLLTDGSGIVIVSNSEAAEGKYYALSPDLTQILWTLPVPYNYYAGPQLGCEGILVTAGAGTTLKGWKTAQSHPAVAWFHADQNRIIQGGVVQFTDLSSFGPQSWEWTFEGGVPEWSNQQNPGAITYPSPGLFQVTLSVGNTSGTDTVTRNCFVRVDETTGKDEPQQPAFDIFPNPNHGRFTVITNEPVSGQMELVIFSSTGSMIKSVKINPPCAVDLNASLAPGIYYLRSQTGRNIITRKLVIY